MNQSQQIIESLVESGFDSAYPRAGKEVSGLQVGGNIANLSSISASINDWEELRGIREVRFKQFKEMPPIVKSKRNRELAQKIRDNGWIDPLIVVEDGDPRGPYILEGSHRWDALRILKVLSFPALVVLDTEAIEER